MSYLRSFAPWIAYALLSSLDWRLAMCVAAVVAGILVVTQRRAHDLDLLTGVTFAFFTVMAVIALAAPHTGLHHWTPALSAATLAVIAAGSLAARRPFTLSIARRTTPSEFWDSPLFLHANDVITAAWAAAFTTSAVVCGLIIHANPSGGVVLIAAQIAGFVVPALFTKNYTERIKKGREAPAAAA